MHERDNLTLTVRPCLQGRQRAAFCRGVGKYLFPSHTGSSYLCGRHKANGACSPHTAGRQALLICVRRLDNTSLGRAPPHMLCACRTGRNYLATGQQALLVGKDKESRDDDVPCGYYSSCRLDLSFEEGMMS
ncbi:hypothetical protein Taro_005811 [Colocasia esculenta]|uniref:Uncharacterized protein n=1 Tax=Colocasia esculenta TaxID=4460 RepID=A0A843TVB6_COLES|nr:hypothetical protein [Colocasia esculenta]